ncbi:MAG TPA: glycosyltransferase family A protein [Candidatus Binataceae bacterium]|nr:glycosyltransferase family A protein [Candidatus Binataceae bacterium]
MTTPEISVIVPTYNRRAMVREAIASVLAQRGASFELIVVDDGSTDGTWEDLARRAGCGDSTLRAIRTANRGPAAARNCGLALARGRLIAFLDSDDLWAPDKLARQSAFMRANPHLAISQTAELWLRNGQRVNPGRRHLKRPGYFFADALRTCLISPSAVIVKRALLDEAGGFDEAMAACEDYDLWLRILARHPVGLLDEPLVTRRAGHPGQLSATIPALDRFRILALAKLLGDGTLDAERRAAAAEVMEEKCAIYAHGLACRGRAADAAFFIAAGRAAVERWRRAPDAELGRAIARMRATLTVSRGAGVP